MANNKKKKKTTKRKKKSSGLDQESKRYLIGIGIIVIAIIALLKLGIVGDFLYRLSYFGFGKLTIVFIASVIVWSVLYIFKKPIRLPSFKVTNMIVVIMVTIGCILASLETTKVGMAVFSEYTMNFTTYLANPSLYQAGILNAFIYSLLSLCFDRLGTYLVLGIAVLVSVTLLLNDQHKAKIKDHLFAKKAQRESKKALKVNQDSDDLDDFNEYIDESSVATQKSLFFDINDDEPVNEEPIVEPMTSLVVEYEVVMDDIAEVSDDRQLYQDGMPYDLPKMNLLSAPKKLNGSANQRYASEAGQKLITVLNQFGVKASLVATHIGPTITKFEIKPEQGTRVSKISNLAQDIKMGLSAKEIRIEAPIPGKDSVGIEIPNKEKSLVNISEVLRSSENDLDNKMLFALGKGLTGESVCGSLDKMPHMLIAGATGSGKSVCVNSIIISILMRARPDEVKMLLIDPKKVEFTPFRELPHLIAPVITDAQEASRALKVVVEMMDKRYDVFAKVGVRNIQGYKAYLEKHPDQNLKPMSYIAVVIDELADLMLVAAKDVEASIQRLTQLARAAGIHLIVATQRPSVDVITGVIKANIPSRIAFAVSSAVDSRTILDTQGAEQLLGYGDMLYLPSGENNPLRLQGCFVSDDEVTRVANFCASQAKPKYEDVFLKLDQIDRGNLGESKFSDPIYEDVKRFVIETQKASTSLIQRKFSLGYARAARLIDMLEESGIIGPSNGSKPREVYVKELKTTE